jgi:hypothetical protein
MTSTLVWTASGAATLTLTNSADSTSVTETGSNTNVTPAATTTYTLTATNSLGKSVTATATVTVVAAPVINSFTASPTSIASGTSVTLSWSTSNAATLVLTNSVDSTAVTETGTSTSVSPNVTTTYTLTATNAAGNSVSSTATVTVTSIYISLADTVSTVAPSGTSTITATLTNDTGSAGVTWALSGSGALSSSTTTSVVYTAPATVTAPFTATITATSIADTSKSSTIQIAVTSSCDGAHNSYLKGNYAFHFNGFQDSDSTQAVAIGVLIADGSGTITGGTEDFNSTGGESQYSLTGTYCVDSSNTGVLAVTTSGGTNSLEFSLGSLNSSSVATAGRMVQADPTGTGVIGTGELLLQTTSAFSAGTVAVLDGGYAFTLRGEGSSSESYAAEAGGGILTLDGTGTAGVVVDQLKVNKMKLDISAAGTYTAPDSNSGRFTLTLNSPLSTSFAGYMVDASHAYLMTTASHASSMLMSGDAYKQQLSSFSASDLNGLFLIYEDGYDPGMSAQMTNIMEGTANGATSSNVTVTASEMKSGSSALSTDSAVGTYTITVDSTGRAVNSVGLSVLYMIDSGSALMVDGGSSSSPTVVTGRLVSQSAISTLTVANLAGNYFLSTLPGFVSTLRDMEGVATLDSTGGLSATDYFVIPGSAAVENSDTATLGTIDAYGRFSISALDTVCFAVSTSEIVCTDTSSSNPKMLLLQK